MTAKCICCGRSLKLPTGFVSGILSCPNCNSAVSIPPPAPIEVKADSFSSNESTPIAIHISTEPVPSLYSHGNRSKIPPAVILSAVLFVCLATMACLTILSSNRENEVSEKNFVRQKTTSTKDHFSASRFKKKVSSPSEINSVHDSGSEHLELEKSDKQLPPKITRQKSVPSMKVEQPIDSLDEAIAQFAMPELDRDNLPQALKRVVDEEIEDEDQDEEILSREMAELMLQQLKSDPSPSNRVSAALGLGRRPDMVDEVVVALLDAVRTDPVPEVRRACLRAFGQLRDLGENENTVKKLLKKIVFEASEDANRKIAAESLIAIDPNGADTKQILRTALIGGKGLKPFPTINRSANEETIRHNRLWAYEQLRSSRIDADWAIGILIKICEVEIDASAMGGLDEYYLKQTASLAVNLGYQDPRVLAHLKKYTNAVFPQTSRANPVQIHYDSLIKEIEKLNKEGE